MVHTTQQAVLGCWDVGAGATLALTPVGKHSVAAEARFTQRPRGGPAVMREPGRWSAASGGYLVPCRPRSQHGSVCLVRPAAAGLSVAVIAFGHGGVSRGVVETLVAPRCRARP
ncbi:MAG: hypothetical protein IPL61_02130 [Myxococcales bacterium]|nr:hypothetical protein [Myxococcales bacterium]